MSLFWEIILAIKDMCKQLIFNGFEKISTIALFMRFCCKRNMFSNYKRCRLCKITDSGT